MTTGIKFSGFGGQGVILAGMIVGRAASIYDNKYAVHTQVIGPEARGSACSASVIISGEKILFPYVPKPDILMALSQEAGARFLPTATDNATVLIEEDLVKLKDVKPGMKVYAIPATRLAEELGSKVSLNVVMIGFFAAVTKLISYDAAKAAVKDSVPSHTEAVNIAALDRGYEYGKKLVS